MNHAIETITAILQFVLAGNARFTVVNNATGNRFTFQVKANKNEKFAASHWVELLTGPNNTSDYEGVGMLFEQPSGGVRYGHKRNARIGRDAQSVQAFMWLMDRLESGRALPESVEVLHEGRCGRCGRALTTPESISSGLGPVCQGLSQ